MKILRNTRENKDFSQPTGFSEWKIATPWSRLTAQLIDQGIVGFAVFSFLASWFSAKIWTPQWWLTLIFLWAFVSTVVQMAFIWFYKNTPGKQSMGLKISSARPQSQIKVSQILIRSFMWWVGAFTLGSGWITVLTRNDRRAWHDLASETIVVRLHGEPAYPTEMEQFFGEGWITLLSTAFFSLLAGVVLVQIDRMGNFALFESKAKTFQFASLSDSLLPVADQIQIVENNLKSTEPGTKPYFDLKARWIRLLFQSNQFGFAKDLALTELHASKNVTDEFADLACEAQVLDSCSFEKANPCLDKIFYKDFAVGCALSTQPNTFESQAQAFGFWWNQANDPKFKTTNLNSWDSFRKNINVSQTMQIEKDLLPALDFALSIKSENPENLMEKASAIDKENVLWGWAHKKALKEFGNQWSALLPSKEQSRITAFRLNDRETNRSVASEKNSSVPVPAVVPDRARSHRE